MFVCNGKSPCPTLTAEEGDLVELTVHSDSYLQSSIHWYVSAFIVVTHSTFPVFDSGLWHSMHLSDPLY